MLMKAIPIQDITAREMPLLNFPLEKMRMCVDMNVWPVNEAGDEGENEIVRIEALIGICVEPNNGGLVFSAVTPRVYEMRVFAQRPDGTVNDEAMIQDRTHEQTKACLIEGLCDYFELHLYGNDLRERFPTLNFHTPK